MLEGRLREVTKEGEGGKVRDGCCIGCVEEALVVICGEGVLVPGEG